MDSQGRQHPEGAGAAQIWVGCEQDHAPAWGEPQLAAHADLKAAGDCHTLKP